MRELVDDDVVAAGRDAPALRTSLPRQHHRPAFHRLAGQHLVVLVDDAVVVGDLALRPHLRRVHDDADEAVVARPAPVAAPAARPAPRWRRPSRRSSCRPPAPLNSLRSRNRLRQPAQFGRCRPRSRAAGRGSAPACASTGRRVSRAAAPRRCSRRARASALPQLPQHHRSRRPTARRGCEAVARQAQHLGAPRPASRSQSLSTWRLKPGRQRFAARPVGVAVHQLAGAGGVQPVARQRPASTSASAAVGVGALALGFAGVADARAAIASRSAQRPGQERLLPAGAAHLGAEAPGSGCRPGTARRHGSAARAGPRRDSSVGSGRRQHAAGAQQSRRRTGSRGCRP